MPIANTCSIGYPHDGRADNAAYRHDRRADNAAYRHDRRADSLSLPNRLKIEVGTIENSRTQSEICNDLDFVCVNTEKPGYVFIFVSGVKINR